MFFDITSLPLKVSCSILSSWLPMKSVVFLDSSFCNSKRCNLLRLLEARELVYLNPVDLQDGKILKWLQSKSLHVSNVVFSPETKPSQLLVKYFAAYGHSIRHVHFRGEGDDIEKMFLVACFCKNLDVIWCTNVSLSSAFHAMLVNNPNLKEIWIHDCNCLVENLMSDVSLNKLTLFSAKTGTCKTDFPWCATTHCPSLQRAECSILSNCYSRSLEELIHNCHQLRSFSCHGTCYSDAHFASFFAKPLELVNLDISWNDAVTDNSILNIAQTLPSLRTLNIQKCKSLTVHSLSHVTEYCKQIEVLYVDIVHANHTTEQAIEAFSQKCNTITYLNVRCSFVLCHTTCTSSLINGCSRMHTLVVEKADTICASSRAFCALIRPHLSILVHDASTEYNVLTLPI